jgi:hypothetical protein
MTDLKSIYQIVEETLASYGVDPVLARNDGDGQWMLITSEKIELYLDVWAADNQHWSSYFVDEERVVFQIIAPILSIPADNKEIFADLMDINMGLYGASLMVKKDEGMVCVKYRIALQELRPEHITEAFNMVSHYAELLQNNLSDMYKLEKILAEEA